MLRGLNHLTLAVRELLRSVDFYHRILGFHLEATRDAGAYLSLGGLWLCLSRGDAMRGTHFVSLRTP